MRPRQRLCELEVQRGAVAIGDKAIDTEAQHLEFRARDAAEQHVIDALLHRKQFAEQRRRNSLKRRSL